jgi:hypothetical protein
MLTDVDTDGRRRLTLPSHVRSVGAFSGSEAARTCAPENNLVTETSYGVNRLWEAAFLG